MNLYFRLLRTLLVSILRREPIDPLGQGVLRFRAWPTDLDLNGHVNNGRYFTLMDLGRVHLIARIGVLRVALRNRWMPVLGAATMRFRRSIGLFRGFTLATRVVCWSENWFVLEQRFLRGDRVVAEGFVRGVFVGRNGPVPADEVLRAAGITVSSPPIPEAVAQWHASMARS
jgi:acyl-CoA thioesterase FadM